MEQNSIKISMFLPWDTLNQFEAAEICYSKFSAKKSVIPIPGIVFLAEFRTGDIYVNTKPVTSFTSAVKPAANEFPCRKIYLTDEERNLVFAGTIESYEVLEEKINIVLLEVQVYDYSSCTPLYCLPRITISRSKDKLYKEEFS